MGITKGKREFQPILAMMNCTRLINAKKYFVNRAYHHDDKHHSELVQNRNNFHHTHIGPSFTLVFDYIHFKPVYVEDTFVQVSGGYRPADLINGGWGFLEQIILPEDIARLQLVYKKWNEVLFQVPVQERKQYHMSLDYRIKRLDGTVARLLQQNILFEFDTFGNIIYSLDKCTDISHWKRDEEMVLSIIGPDPAKNLIYYPSQDLPSQACLFTKAEIRVLSLLAEGCSSKEIADYLFLAVTTVETHRKRMIKKAKVKNTTELVRFAISHRII